MSMLPGDLNKKYKERVKQKFDLKYNQIELEEKREKLHQLKAEYEEIEEVSIFLFFIQKELKRNVKKNYLLKKYS